MDTQMFLIPSQGKEVRRITRKDAEPFLLNIHYARRIPSITDAFGLFVDGDLVGVVTYGIPPSVNLCVGLAGVENQYNVKELNRLVLLPNYNSESGENHKNYASYLVSHSLKMLGNKTFVVSYADTAWTHVGYIYQATNFLYTGLSAKRNDGYQPGGKHPRNYDKELNKECGVLQTRSQKHRYVYLVGDKRTKKQMLKELKYPILPYPKGEEKHYDVENPIISKPVEVVKRKNEYRERSNNIHGVTNHKTQTANKHQNASQQTMI